MEDFRIEPETAAELQRLRRKDRFYTWICAIILSVILAVVVGLYLSYRPPVAKSAGRAGNNPAVLNGGAKAAQATSRAVMPGAGNPVDHRGARCGFSGGNSCCGSPRQVESDDRLKRLADMALAKFRTEVGHQPVTAKVTDYGCHIQIDIYDSGNKVIKHYGYQSGTLYEIK